MTPGQMGGMPLKPEPTEMEELIGEFRETFYDFIDIYVEEKRETTTSDELKKLRDKIIATGNKNIIEEATLITEHVGMQKVTGATAEKELNDLLVNK